MGERETLLALAGRCEKAEGADRQLDYAIFMATAIKERANYWHPIDGNQFSGSLDAAMTLVPQGCWAEGAFGVNRGRSSIEIHAPMTFVALGLSVAATPALALTAACLRALAVRRCGQ